MFRRFQNWYKGLDEGKKDSVNCNIGVAIIMIVWTIFLFIII